MAPSRSVSLSVDVKVLLLQRIPSVYRDAGQCEMVVSSPCVCIPKRPETKI